jgi:uncharacterized protein
MSVFLLDVNVLVALSWQGHEAHERAQRWFFAHSRNGWATCPFTQAGFVRVISNPAFSKNAVTAGEALGALRVALQHPKHEFWPAELSYADAITAAGINLRGHQQVTDAYLMGLAIRKKGKLATLDRSIAGLDITGDHRQHLEVIS